MLLEIRNSFFKNFNIRFWCTLLMTMIWKLNAVGQAPFVKIWDKTLGGLNPDYPNSLIQTYDNGFVIAGNSWSGAGGDKSQANWGNADFWIVKLDSLGNKQWDKDFGGTDFDFLYSIQQTFDKGFIFGGYTLSGIGGDKTEASWGGLDYWIVKTDSLGNLQWDKRYGGTADDYLYSICQTRDSGFVLAGATLSGISGDKTQSGWGSLDYWLVKIDSTGNLQWDKDFGGTDAEYLISIDQTTDGGFILGGYSNSGIGGDKSQNTVGSADYWLVKVDSIGNKEWDKTFGGPSFDQLGAVHQTFDGGYILGGKSISGIGGDKTESGWGLNDFWMVKTDASGNKQWDKDFGGNDNDEFGQLIQTSDGGFLISGDSYSFISGNKTESNLGYEQEWVVKTDSAGNLIYDKTIFTSGHDENGLSMQAADGCLLFSTSSNSGIAGYKTQSAVNNSNDYWLIKFCETPIANFTSSTFLCPGTCTNFINQSYHGTSYQWNFFGGTPSTSTDINPGNICYANPGNYDVLLTATNANGSDILLLNNYITVYPSPAPQGITQHVDTLFANTGNASYQWYYNGSAISGATGYYYVASLNGDYNVVATDTNGCEVEAAIFNVISGLSPVLFKGEGVFVSPNPVDRELEIKNSELRIQAAGISIFNLMGERILAHIQKYDQGLKVNCEHLPPGIYFLEIAAEGKLNRIRFVK